MENKIKIIECPRDAMQGIKKLIPTEKKVEYANTLLKVGYDTIDVGSFVSPTVIPQMADTAFVLEQLELDDTKSKLLVIVANERGAFDACQFEQIDYLGFPFSISEQFQQRNTNASIEQALIRLKRIKEMADASDKELVVYISMGFGNPYGEEWNTEIVEHWVDQIIDLDVNIISLSDTIGVADKNSIAYLFGELIPKFPHIEFGAHLHTAPHNWLEKVETAYQSGCRRFDGAIRGFGGCPMAKDDLVGNFPTENLLQFFRKEEIDLKLDQNAFDLATIIALNIFPAH